MNDSQFSQLDMLQRINPKKYAEVEAEIAALREKHPEKGSAFAGDFVGDVAKVVGDTVGSIVCGVLDGF